MGNLLSRVVCRSRLRILNHACVLAAAIERIAAGVADFHAVDDQCVVAESWREGQRSDGPESVRLLLHIQFRPAPEIELDFRGVRSFHAELGPGATDRKSTRLNSSHLG